MKVPYSEGSLFLVPLKSGGYARGVVARATNKGPALIGYFFGPRLASNIDVPRENLVPANAILCVRLGDLGLINGEWQIHGKVPNWKREEWPMPDFVRREPGKTKPVLVRYSDNFPLRVVKKYPVDDDSKLVRDMGWGDQAVQKRLSDILDGAEPEEQNRSEIETMPDDVFEKHETLEIGERDKLSVGVLHGTRGKDKGGKARLIHYLYLDKEEAARRVGSELAADGFEVEVSLSGACDKWLILAAHRLSITEETLETFRNLLESIILKERGGEYDGWEVEH